MDTWKLQDQQDINFQMSNARLAELAWKDRSLTKI